MSRSPLRPSRPRVRALALALAVAWGPPITAVAAVPGVEVTPPGASVAAPDRVESESAGFRVEVLVDGLSQPTALVFLPDGRALLAERRSARISLLDVESGELLPLTGVPEMITGHDSGLHDVALHPDYQVSGWIYLSYSAGTPERSTLAVDRARLSGGALVERQRVFTADAYSEDLYHFGGRLAFAGGYLYVTVGDRHHQDRAQDRSQHAGTIVRLLDDGRVPPGNPFVGRAGIRSEIWSYGHRNPQGLAVHPGTGELWSHEHGPLAGDELNLVRKGANFGWPVVSYGWEYSGGPIGQGIVTREGIDSPVWVWTPAIAPSGMVFYRGDAFPRWKGDLLVGSMSQQHLDRLVVRDGRVVLEERILDRRVGRVRLVAEGPDGSVYLGSDDGLLLRLRP